MSSLCCEVVFPLSFYFSNFLVITVIPLQNPMHNILHTRAMAMPSLVSFMKMPRPLLQHTLIILFRMPILSSKVSTKPTIYIARHPKSTFVILAGATDYNRNPWLKCRRIYWMYISCSIRKY